MNQAFSPSQAQLEMGPTRPRDAEQHHGQAFKLDGRMVDLPVIRLAEETLRID